MRPSRPAAAERLLLPLRSTSRSPCPHARRFRQPLAQSFHSTPSRPAKRRPLHRSISKVEMERIVAARAKANYTPLTPDEKARLAERYTPDQMAAIEAAEQAISPKDIARQARVRADIFAPTYVDDMSRIRPVVDMKPSRLRGEGMNYEEVVEKDKDFRKLVDEEEHFEAIGERLIDVRFDDEESLHMLAEETGEDMRGEVPLSQVFSGEAEVFPDVQRRQLEADIQNSRKMDEMSQIEINVATQHFAERGFERTPSNITLDLDEFAARASPSTSIPPPPPKSTSNQSLASKSRYEAERAPKTIKLEKDLLSLLGDHSDSPHEAAAIPMIRDEKVHFEATDPDAKGDETTAVAEARTAKILDVPIDDLNDLRTKIIVRRSVVNQTRLGKIRSQYVMTVVGDENGMIGLGEGKASEAPDASRISRLNAYRDLKPIRRYENRTIFGDVTGKCGAVELTISTRPPGFGLRVSQHIYEIAKCAGLHDLSAKVHRSRNPMNVAKAAVQALQSQKDPQDVALARGMKMVDARKVYYAGLV